jgi:hypothetical protein
VVVLALRSRSTTPAKQWEGIGPFAAKEEIALWVQTRRPFYAFAIMAEGSPRPTRSAEVGVARRLLFSSGATFKVPIYAEPELEGQHSARHRRFEPS